MFFMKTTGREFFYSVSGLMVPKYLVNDKLADSIDEFIESVPVCTETLERFITSGMDMESFVSEMEKLYIKLCAIHAYWLETESARILRLTESNETELCRKLLTPFITNVRTLAIDIQMAQNQSGDIIYHNRGQLESCNDVVSGMNILNTLLAKDDFKKAFDVAKSVNELQDSEYIMPLISSILSQDRFRALELVKEIKSVYSQKSDELTSNKNETSEPKKILVVDDMPEILTVVSYMLKEHYQVLAFKSAREALKAIEDNHQPDAFLLDIDMPRIDGFRLAEKIRMKDIFLNTPILFLTSNSTRDNLIKSTEFAPTTFIVKPVNKEIILSRLSALLASSN